MQENAFLVHAQCGQQRWFVEWMDILVGYIVIVGGRNFLFIFYYLFF